MQSFAKGLSRPRARRQSGSVAMLGALWLMIAVICLATIDIGNLFWQKRELQKIADLAALGGGATVASACQDNARSSARQNGLNEAALDGDALVVECGSWSPRRAGGATDYFVAGGTPFNASRVTVTRGVPYFFLLSAGQAQGRLVVASATAARKPPAAALSVRSTLLSVDSSQSPLLDALFSGLLQSSVKIDAVGWQGLLDTRVSLLQFLDALAVELNVAAGDYDGLLKADARVGSVLTALLGVVRQQQTAGVVVDALQNLVKAAASVGGVPLTLGQLLKLQTGLPASALDLGLRAFDLVQAVAQLGNANSAAVAALDLPLGLAGISVKLKVIEPPQLSAIGDPSLAKQNPTGEHAIFVRTAQVRTLISAEVPLASAVTGLVNGVLVLLSPVLTTVNLLLGGIPPKWMDIQVLPPPVRLDIALDVGSGSARLTDYSCQAGNKWLHTRSTTAVSNLRIGRMGNTPADAANAAFSSKVYPIVQPLVVADVGCLGCNGAGRTPLYFGGLGASVDSPVGENIVDPHVFANPPRLEQAPLYQSVAAKNIVGSLAPTVAQIQLMRIPATGSPNGLLTALLGTVFDLLGGLSGAVAALISQVLSPLLDPLVNVLLKALGIDLATTDVGVQLNCAADVQLVF